jgi:hypothetical protein
MHARHGDTILSSVDAPDVPEFPQPVAEGVPRLEALRLRDVLTDAGIPVILHPDGGSDLARPTNVLVPPTRAAFARRVLADDEDGNDWVPDDSTPGLVARIEEHLAAVTNLVEELARRLREPGRR